MVQRWFSGGLEVQVWFRGSSEGGQKWFNGSCVAELFPAPEIQETSRIQSFSGNSTEFSVLFQNFSKSP